MMTYLSLQALKTFADLYGQLFALSSPLGAVTPFLELTDKDKEMRLCVARRAALAMTILLTLAMLVGGWLLKFFGGIGCFRCAGGVLIFMMGLDMSRGRNLVTVKSSEAKRAIAEAEELRSDVHQELLSLAVVPLAMPLLVGPGTISVVIALAEAGNKILLLPAIMLLSLTVYILLRLASSEIKNERLRRIVKRFIGPTALMVGNRIMGLLTMALAFYIFKEGIKNIIPEFVEVYRRASLPVS